MTSYLQRIATIANPIPSVKAQPNQDRTSHTQMIRNQDSRWEPHAKRWGRYSSRGANIMRRHYWATQRSLGSLLISWDCIRRRSPGRDSSPSSGHSRDIRSTPCDKRERWRRAELDAAEDACVQGQPIRGASSTTRARDSRRMWGLKRSTFIFQKTKAMIRDPVVTP